MIPFAQVIAGDEILSPNCLNRIDPTAHDAPEQSAAEIPMKRESIALTPWVTRRLLFSLSGAMLLGLFEYQDVPLRDKRILRDQTESIVLQLRDNQFFGDVGTMVG